MRPALSRTAGAAEPPGRGASDRGSLSGQATELRLRTAGMEPRDVILGLDGQSHDAAVIASAKKVALLASRTNTALSIPMLMCMIGFAHGIAKM